jgi:hypothetical protein
MIINEQIIGNTAIVYHRGDENKLNRLLNKTYSNSKHIDFNNYDKALYTTTNIKAQTNQFANVKTMKETFGDYIIKLAFKGVSNCWFCSYNEYKKYNNCTINNWKEQQFKKFNIDKKYWRELAGNNENFTADHKKVSKFFEDANLLGTRVKGIQYDDKYIKDCLLIYDWTTAVPLAITNDEGKIWKKIDKSKTTFQRKNFKNNDYIDTNKKIKYVFKTDKDGSITCNFKNLSTLEGIPQTVKGSLWCSYNNLTTLKGAPREIKGDFWCSQNKLSKEEVINYLKTAKIGGDIVTDYGRFKNQKEALEKLTTIKESYFNY